MFEFATRWLVCLVLLAVVVQSERTIKGQKWGVRRYQNPDGTLTSMGKARKRAIDVNRNMDAVNDIVKTMSRKDKELLNLDGDVYQQSAEDGYAYVKRFIEKSGDVPISFF